MRKLIEKNNSRQSNNTTLTIVKTETSQLKHNVPFLAIEHVVCRNEIVFLLAAESQIPARNYILTSRIYSNNSE